jgi:electron transfer flavoprotein alpha subunit
MPPEIVVVAETSAGALAPVTLELCALARRLAAARPAPVRLIVLDEDPEELAALAARRCGAAVTAASVPGLSTFNGDRVLRALAAILADARPLYVIAAHSAKGLDFAPGLAARLAAGCITGVEALQIEGGRPAFIRSVYGGKFVARVAPTAETTVLTVQPGCFRPEPAGAREPGRVERIRVAPPESRSRTLAVLAPEPAADGIEEADVVVAAGRGIGAPERLALIGRLAALFPRSAVAGSRIACDLGWLEYRRQVGVTGRTVAPRLYIACGISGAVQHLAGMRGSGFVVAINRDPAAPIFREADVGVVDDLAEFIPLMIAAAGERDPG